MGSEDRGLLLVFLSVLRDSRREELFASLCGRCKGVVLRITGHCFPGSVCTTRSIIRGT